MPTTHSARYCVEITVFTWETVESKLKQAFQHLMNKLFPSEEEDEEEEEEDPEIVDQKFKTAWEIFKALLPSCPHFQDNETIKEYLSKSEHLPMRLDVRTEIIQAARTLYERINGQIAAQPFYYETAEQLWKHVMPFTHGQEEDSDLLEPNPWPFVELVSYVVCSYLCAYELT